MCLQDEANPGVILKFNSVSGNYEFTKCGPKGFTLSGQRSISTTICTITLSDSRADRLITASFNKCQRNGTASVRVTSNLVTTTYMITDHKTTDNTCSCPP